MTGIFEARPYPILRVPASTNRPARAVMLAGQSKIGVESADAMLDGRWVAAGGVFVKRGDMDMLLVGDADLLVADPAPAPAILPAAIPLGRWRLTGEICDGKCYAGAMRPGTGLAHKACANICLRGGVPPVFVSTAPIEGRGFFLMANGDGGPLPARFLDYTAVPIELEGTIERRDDLMILRVDPSSFKAPRS